MRDPRWFLTAGVLGILLLLLLGAVVSGLAVGPTYLADIVAIATLLAMVVLWAVSRPTAHLGTAQRVFLAGGFLAWAVCVVKVLTGGFPTQPALLLMGAMLGLALLRPPDARASGWLLDVLAVGVSAVSLVVLLMEVVGLKGSWYDELQLGDLLTMERSMYWTPLADLLGLDGRWAGPFDHPGRAGQVGALILVWGLTRRGWVRPVLVAAGALFVLLAGSNTAYLSVAVGLALLVVVTALRRFGQLPRWLARVAIAGALLAVVLLLVVIVGPNTGLTGRTTIWPTYLELWRSSPWTGVGDVGIGAAQHAGLLPAWAYHAHNSWLDLLVRYGVPALVLSVVAIGGAAVATVGYARRGSAGPLAVLAVLLVASITQPMIVWLLPTIPMTMLVLAVLASGPDPGGPGQPREDAVSARQD